MLNKLTHAILNNLVDEEAIPIINLINSQDGFISTSSCAGRIAILEIRAVGMKKNSHFLYKKHNIPSSKELQVILQTQSYQLEGWLLVEPPVFHIGAKDLQDAKDLLNIGFKAGLSRSGIRSLARLIIVQLWGTGHLNVPIGTKEKNFLENNDDYTFFLVSQAIIAMKHGKKQLYTLKELLNKRYVA